MDTLLQEYQQQLKQARALDDRPHFFDTPEEYERAVISGLIGENTVCIVDDPTNDETTVISNKK